MQINSETIGSYLMEYQGATIVFDNGREALLTGHLLDFIGEYNLVLQVKLKLYPYSCLTDEQKLKVAEILGAVDHLSPESRIHQVTELFENIYNGQTNIPGIGWFRVSRYLRSLHIDIYGLIKLGFAVEWSTPKEITTE